MSANRRKFTTEYKVQAMVIYGWGAVSVNGSFHQSVNCD